MRKAFYYETPYGPIGIAEREGKLTHIFFAKTVRPKDFVLEETELLQEAAKQLLEYFAGERRIFQLPLAPEGTPFQREVWQALLEIPYGETRTYSQVAQQIGRPRAVRAMGRANGLNPASIIIPCHRVLGMDGSLTGYAGGLPMKEALLRMEQGG